MAKKIIIILYSMYGHVFKLAQEIKKGIEKTGAEVTIYKVAETLPEEGTAFTFLPSLSSSSSFFFLSFFFFFFLLSSFLLFFFSFLLF